ncbi:MAG TPA: translation initiation factor IF-2 [Bacteroidales bacterium]|nr:translation initiation factor IF-2 [Bacteroidales bacterium]
MAIRLIKASREFNVGISTIVEFLEKKGHAIDSDPNSKIPDELYQLIEKEFQTEGSVKKAAKQIDLSETRKKQEIITISDMVEPPKQPEEGTIETVIPEFEHKLNVVGKIDLNSLKKGKLSKQEAPKQESIEEKVITKPEKPITPVSVTIEKPQEIEEVEEDNDEDEIEETDLDNEDEDNDEDENSEVEPNTESIGDENETTEAQDDIYRPNKTVLENTVKVLGQIDLSSLNQKTRPDRKSKKEKEQERKARKDKFKQPSTSTATPETKTEQNQEPQKPKESKEDFYKASIDTIKKPTVIGKIELDPDAKDDFERKKRKRIKKGKIDISAKDVFDLYDKVDKPSVKKGVTKKPRIIHEEVNLEDVDKQIKDTMARLVGGKKTKSSKYRRDKRDAIRQEMEEQQELQSLEDKILKVTEFISANDLSSMMDIPATQIISTCMSVGLFISLNQRLDAETIQLIAGEFGYEVQFISAEIQEAIDEIEDKPEDLIPRPPIVTVMGHVDHGKTSLLDYVRKTNVIAGEAGGITQHIGAYSVQLPDNKKITFLDTPGHEAFTAMRARGAQVTDIVIIVVAADDSVMPQTIEAINHASAAGVPIIFAINKIDKDGANPDKIREQLANMNYLVEEWGGKYQSQEISAKFGKKVDELMEKVLLEAELLELKANPNKPAYGTVIESELDKGRGYVSTIMVTAGTLRVGDIMLAGTHTGKVKAMFNERNQKITEAGPSTPVIVLGLDGAPQAGDKFHVMKTEREAREIANKREQLQREQELKTLKHITLDEIGRRIAIGNFQELSIIIKGDVDGSVEALADSLIKLSTEEIQVAIKHKAVGQISESDVLLASASDAIIIGFQVRPSLAARKLAEKEGIDIRLYSIIYDAINEVKDAMTGMLSPEIKEEILGSCEIREVFKITKVGTVAGCFVTDGKIVRNAKIRIIRDGIVVYTGDLGSLKRFKEDVKEVTRGYECGLNIHNYNDIKEGDIIEAFEQKEVKRKL